MASVYLCVIVGQQVYDAMLKPWLELEQTGHFVAIEPETGSYFLGSTGTEALVAVLLQEPLLGNNPTANSSSPLPGSYS